MKTLEGVFANGRVILTIREDDRTVFRDNINPTSARSRSRAVSVSGVGEEVFLTFLDEVAKKTTHTFVVPDATVASGPKTITYGSISGGGDRQTDPITDLRTVVERRGPDTVVSWASAADIAVLDIDYHESSPPPRTWLTATVSASLTPSPAFWGFSRNGGVHAFYYADSTHTAEEKAAVAALRWRLVDASAGVEILHRVRCHGEPLIDGLNEPAASIPWLGCGDEVDEEAREEWLTSRSMTLDSRYDHTHCPIAGSDDASKNNPVTVSEAGVYCHRCAGKGVALGSRRPGWAPWGALLGAPSAGELGACIRNCVHYGHAKWVLTETYGFPDSLARLAYSAAIKAHHGADDARLGAVFAVETADIARVGDQWSSVSTGFDYPKDIKAILSRLPITQSPEDGRVNKALVEELAQPKDHSRFGYRGLSIVHGFRMIQADAGKGRTTVRVGNPALPRRAWPEYVPVVKRTPLPEAWGVIESIAPGIDKTLVTAAIVAFACAQETRAGLLPVLFVSGASGSAKTSTLKIAAGIYGACTGDVIYEPDPSRFRQSIRSGARSGPAVIFNEVLKDSSRGHRGVSAKEALDPILNLTADSQSWQAYLGPVKLGRPPALFLTEPVCPLELRDETQLARRIRHHRVFGVKDEWKNTLTAAGIGGDLHAIRGVSREVASACDAILSSICDDWFSGPVLTWDTIADALGVKTILDSPDFDDTSVWYKEFFRLVCSTPVDDGRYKGYVRISRTEDAPRGSVQDSLLSVYSMFADGQNSKDWKSSRRLGEKDWSRILTTAEHVWYDQRTDGSAVYVRFRVGPANRPVKTNAQIVDPSKWEALS